MKFFTKGDKIVAGLVALISFSSYLIFSFFTLSTLPGGIEVFVDGKLYSSYNLSDLKKEEIIDVNSGYGTMTMKITMDGVQIANASCPDKRCIKEGKISKSGQTLICIPNKTLIKITGKNNSKVDRVTY